PPPRAPFCFASPATPSISPLSLHDALPISSPRYAFSYHASSPSSLTSSGDRSSGRLASISSAVAGARWNRAMGPPRAIVRGGARSEEHTSELQSLTNLVCRLLLEKKTTARLSGASVTEETKRPSSSRLTKSYVKLESSGSRTRDS